MISIVFAGGGTAGHVGPLLAMAREAVRKIPHVHVTVVGTAAGLETRLVPEAGFKLVLIDKVAMPRRLDKDLFTFPWRYRAVLKQAEEILVRSNADVLVGVGGYVSASMYAAAKKLGVPYLVHEANAKAGIANRKGARNASFVGTAFEGTVIDNGVFVGMPIREEIRTLTIDDHAKRDARKSLGVDPERKTLVVVGGSLGAVSINKAVAESLPALAEHDVQVVHITGSNKQLKDHNGNVILEEHYRQYEYIDRMELAYAAADLLIARAGASTVSEVAAIGVPAIFVPLPIGNGEQALNVQGLARSGGAHVVSDSDFNARWILENAMMLLKDPVQLQSMAASSKKYGAIDASKIMVDQIKKIVELKI